VIYQQNGNCQFSILEAYFVMDEIWVTWHLTYRHVSKRMLSKEWLMCRCFLCCNIHPEKLHTFHSEGFHGDFLTFMSGYDVMFLQWAGLLTFCRYFYGIRRTGRNKGITEPADDNIPFYGKGNTSDRLAIDVFVHQAISHKQTMLPENISVDLDVISSNR
jgi:hypothetical protein